MGFRGVGRGGGGELCLTCKLFLIFIKIDRVTFFICSWKKLLLEK